MSFHLPFDPMSLNAPEPTAVPLLRDDQLPILITGVAGVVGFNFFAYMQQQYPGQVIGVRALSNWRMKGEGIIGLDMDDPVTLEKLLSEYQFRSILSCGGSCALKSCELDPEMAHRVNVQSVRSLLQSPTTRDSRIVHLSIDLVYSGTGGGNHLEDDPTDPVTMYGKTMVLAETEFQRLRPDAAILRISLPMGISFNGHAGAVDWIQYRFSNNRPATLFYDEIRTPTYSSCLNRLLEQVLSDDLAGIHHAGGPTQVSLFQIAQIINLVGGYDPDLLQGCPRIDGGPIPPRAGNVTMNSEKLIRHYGKPLFQPWPKDPDLIPDGKKWHYRKDVVNNPSPQLIAEQLYCLPGSFDSSC